MASATLGKLAPKNNFLLPRGEGSRMRGAFPGTKGEGFLHYVAYLLEELQFRMRYKLLPHLWCNSRLNRGAYFPPENLWTRCLARNIIGLWLVMPKEFASLFFVVALEEEFRMHISDEEAADVKTVGELFNYVITRMHDTALPGKTVWHRFCELMMEHMELAADEITPEAPLTL
jgi:hypothetical protein